MDVEAHLRLKLDPNQNFCHELSSSCEAGQHTADTALAGQPPRLAGRGLPRQARAQPPKMPITDVPKDRDGSLKSRNILMTIDDI